MLQGHSRTVRDSSPTPRRNCDPSRKGWRYPHRPLVDMTVKGQFLRRVVCVCASGRERKSPAGPDSSICFQTNQHLKLSSDGIFQRTLLSSTLTCLFHQWEVRLSNSRGVPYFFNTQDQRASWDAPSELTREEIAKLPGAAEYLGKGFVPGGRPSEVRASHLLVKHKDSRKPSSWKEVSRPSFFRH
jgi:hypothetical protein